MMRDDTIRFAEKAKKIGIDIEIEIGEGLFHCYPACAPLFPEANTTMDKIVKFIHNRLSI